MPAPNSEVRFAYTRLLGGVSFDQSVSLEPSQVAGFNQAYRSVIPEAVAGSVVGAKTESYGLSFERRFTSGTYFGIEGQWLRSSVERSIGTIDLLFPPSYVASSTPQRLDYLERNITLTLNQLVGEEWSLGLRYQLSDAELETAYPQIPASVSSASSSTDRAVLHQLALSARFNHHSGFFANMEAVWRMQDNMESESIMPGDNFWQLNLLAGWRFWQRRAQLQVGVLNITDQDYRLNPLNRHSELPHRRVFTVGIQFNL